MATIDLGKIKFNWRGTYAGGTAYVPDDVVEYADGSVTSSYMCVANTTGNAPSSGGTAHASWNFLAKGQAPSPTTTQGDIIVRGASADARLAIGAAGKALKVNSSANGLEYGDLSSVTVGSPVSLGTSTHKDISIDSTNLYKIELVFYQVSVSGNTDFGFRLGYANGTISSGGYNAAAAYFSNASYAGNNYRTDSFRWTGLAGASNVMNGRIIFYKYDTNIYYAEGICMKSDGSDATQYFITGYKDLGAPLTDIRIIASSNNSANFDGGFYKLITHSA